MQVERPQLDQLRNQKRNDTNQPLAAVMGWGKDQGYRFDL